MPRNKSKRSTASSDTKLAPPPSILDDELMNDLLAELDSRDQQDAPLDKVVEERAPKKQSSKVRHLARQARKVASLAQSSPPSNPEVDAQVEREIRQEAASIRRTCDHLGMQIHEINPDGHCLFSAIADQLAILNILPADKANYTAIRLTASSYILQHPDDFLPFLPSISGEDGVGATENTGLMDARRFEQYCLAIRDTAAWGGEPEILALSRAYNIPIQVIQASTPSVVTHTPDGNLLDDLSRDTKIARISFHRRMYGLGEHYNSLRPKNALVAVADRIHSMLG